MTQRTCQHCGARLQVLRRPLTRLRWTRYWWRGLRSFLTGPLSICPNCGTMYAPDGELLATGAVETDAERRLDTYRRDMAVLGDAFGGLVIAAELVGLWLVFGPEGGTTLQVALTSVIGGTALVPCAYFAGRARSAKRDLKQLKKERQAGVVSPPAEH